MYIYMMLSGALLGAIAYLLFILPTKWLKIERLDHAVGLGLKVMQWSDMHVERLRIKPKKLHTLLLKEKPDYLFLTGDFMDQETSAQKLISYLQVVQKTGIKTYAVLGNHDYYIEDTQLIIDLLEQHGIQVLRNTSVQLPTFNLVGIDDYCTEHDDERLAFMHVASDKPVIVLQHDPNMVLTMHHSFDLLLSGHLHGKQLNVPFLFLVKPMGELPKRGIYKGLQKSEKGSYYISKGMGQSGVNIRLFVRSEIAIHTL